MAAVTTLRSARPDDAAAIHAILDPIVRTTARSCETGLALAPKARGAGLGTRLYAALLEALRAHGFPNAFATITVPNPASERLHERAGFRRYGVTERAGWKFDRWHDSSWWQKRLVEGDAAPGELRAPDIGGR